MIWDKIKFYRYQSTQKNNKIIQITFSIIISKENWVKNENYKI